MINSIDCEKIYFNELLGGHGDLLVKHHTEFLSERIYSH